VIHSTRLARTVREYTLNQGEIRLGGDFDIRGLTRDKECTSTLPFHRLRFIGRDSTLARGRLQGFSQCAEPKHLWRERSPKTLTREGIAACDLTVLERAALDRIGQR
jgi:hypothetical protein